VEAQALGKVDKGGYTLEKLAYYSEPGVFIPALLFLPKQAGPRPAVVYVDEEGKSAGRTPEELLEPLAKAGYAALSIDVRGVGETFVPAPGYDRVDHRGFTQNGEADLLYGAMRAGRTAIGLRVTDVLRGVDYLESRAEVNRAKIAVAGKGWGALAALFASALDGRVAGAVSNRMLSSYAAITESELFVHRPSSFVPGVLAKFDLPAVAAAIAPRPVVLVNAVDAQGRRTPLEAAAQLFGAAGGAAPPRLVHADSPGELMAEYRRLLDGL
jgi:hypothetical protein